jgi:CelD/BcsL family acetyltransferase involved in cellulose biosynthesis
MQVTRYRDFDALAPLAADWDRFARGVPFRSWAWASSWWRHYGGTDRAGRIAANSPYVLCAADERGRVVGIAPWYVEASLARGRVLRFLGTGEVCPEYLSLLCEPGSEEAVTEAFVGWLTAAASQAGSRTGGEDAWDLLELEAIEADDPTMAHFAARLGTAGNTVDHRPGMECWRVDLPATWDEYIAQLSKSFRHRVRRMERRLLEAGRLREQVVEHPEDLPRALDILIDLHQRRWQRAGEPGCFASQRFTAFHREVMSHFLANGSLLLNWMELDGSPLVANYSIVSGGTNYSYASGLEPDALDYMPGHLGHWSLIRRSIALGCSAFDFLRGGEFYKTYWRAKPRPSIELRAAPARVGAQLRYGAWRAGAEAKRWLKTLRRKLRRAEKQAEPSGE